MNRTSKEQLKLIQRLLSSAFPAARTPAEGKNAVLAKSISQKLEAEEKKDTAGAPFLRHYPYGHALTV